MSMLWVESTIEIEEGEFKTLREETTVSVESTKMEGETEEDSLRCTFPSSCWAGSWRSPTEFSDASMCEGGVFGGASLENL